MYSQSVYKVPQTLLTVQCTVSHYTRYHKLRAGGAPRPPRPVWALRPPRPVWAQASSGPRRLDGWAARLEQWQRGLFQKYLFSQGSVGVLFFFKNPFSQAFVGVFRAATAKKDEDLLRIKVGAQTSPCPRRELNLCWKVWAVAGKISPLEFV